MRMRVLDLAVVLAFAVMTVAIGLQVIFRYLLNDPLAGSEEVGRLAFVWVTFLGAAVATRDDAHVRIDYFLRRLGPRSALACRILGHVGTAVFGLIMVWVGFLLARFSWDFESASLQFPMTFVHAAIPVAGALMTAAAVGNAVVDLADAKRRA